MFFLPLLPIAAARISLVVQIPIKNPQISNFVGFLKTARRHGNVICLNEKRFELHELRFASLLRFFSGAIVLAMLFVARLAGPRWSSRGFLQSRGFVPWFVFFCDLLRP